MKIKPIGHLVKTNPIQTQSKPIKSQYKAKQTQYKPKQTQFQRQKNAAAFVWPDVSMKRVFLSPQ